MDHLTTAQRLKIIQLFRNKILYELGIETDGKIMVNLIVLLRFEI